MLNFLPAHSRSCPQTVSDTIAHIYIILYTQLDDTDNKI